MILPDVSRGVRAQKRERSWVRRRRYRLRCESEGRLRHEGLRIRSCACTTYQSAALANKNAAIHRERNSTTSPPFVEPEALLLATPEVRRCCERFCALRRRGVGYPGRGEGWRSCEVGEWLLMREDEVES